MPRPVLFAILLTAIGCNPAPTPLVIGHVANLSGSGVDKELSSQAVNGMQLAIDDESVRDGIHRPIAIRHADGKGDLDTIEGQAVRLVRLNQALVLLGGTDAAEANRLGRADALVLSPIGLRTPGMSNLVIATGVSPLERGKALANSLNDKIKPQSLVLLVEPGDTSAAAESGLRTAWAAAKQLEPQRHEIGDPASDVVKKLAAEIPPGALPLVIGSPTTLQALLTESPLRDRPVAYLGPELPWSLFKDRAAPIYLTTSLGGDKTADFVKRYTTKFAAPPEPTAAAAYDDARLAIELVRKGPQPAAKMRELFGSLKESSGLSVTYPINNDRVDRPAYAGTLVKGALK